MRNERKYAYTERGEEGREEASGGEREQRRKVEEQLREDLGGREDREGGRETSREVPWRTLANMLQCTKLYTTRPLPLRLWYHRLNNSEPV